MTFIVDRDLLQLEPSMFVDASSVGTLLASGTDGSVSGGTLSSASVNFATRGVDEGHVALVAGDVLEVLARPSASSLTVTRPRGDASQPTIPPNAGSSLQFSVTTFERQIAEAEAWALGALGIDAHDPVKPLSPEAIINTDEFARIVALRTICDVFALAAARSVSPATLNLRRDAYRELLRRTIARTSILLDLNGDGVPDASRRLSTVTLIRS